MGSQHQVEAFVFQVCQRAADVPHAAHGDVFNLCLFLFLAPLENASCIILLFLFWVQGVNNVYRKWPLEFTYTTVSNHTGGGISFTPALPVVDAVSQSQCLTLSKNIYQRISSVVFGGGMV